MKVLLDEMISPAVAARLRDLGHDAISVHERGTRSSGDAAQMEDAVRMGRAIVSYNLDDFVDLVVQYSEDSRSHFGVILVSQRTIKQSDLGGQVVALAALFDKHPDEAALANQCIYLMASTA